MREIQFTAIILMSLLTLKLLLLPSRATVALSIRRARMLMTSSIALLGVHFLLQYVFKLRTMGVTQAVMLNLAMFIPCSWLLSLSLISLQRRGFISHSDLFMGPLTWVTVMGLMTYAAATDGQPLLAGSEAMRRAEIAASVCYLAMTVFYLWHHYKNLYFLIHALKNFYDEDLGGQLRWMRVSAVMLPLMGMMVPLMIFTGGLWLLFFGLIMFLFLFFLVDSFFNYVLSSAPAKVREAEEHEDEEETAHEENAIISQQNAPMHRVEIAVGQWVANGGHLKSGLKLPTVAEELGVPRYLLTAWLRNQNLKYADWMADLRIEEAKHVLSEHRDWSNEYVSQRCGFTDRTYFQRKFKEKTGLSPSDYQALSASK